MSFFQKRKLLLVLVVFTGLICFLTFRVLFLQTVQSGMLQRRAYEQQTRDRLIAPNRGAIYDRNMNEIATTETVASVSVIYSQVKDREMVAKTLSEMLELNYDDVLKKVSRRVALERIKTKVDKELADEIRALQLPGVVVDEDIRRIYPFGDVAAQVIGFVGKDNQGIIGLEAKYDSFLKGSAGKILTETDARGIELQAGDVIRIPPTDGYNLVTTLDLTLSQYAQQTIEKAVEAKGAKRGLIVMMNPQNGEILAMANAPSFDLNEPFVINNQELLDNWNTYTTEEQMNYLNQMWRNFSLNDTYEPGSTFKIVTAAAGLSQGVVNVNSHFDCNSGRTVGGRFIKCWRSPRSHGNLNFVQGVENSCNPVFMDVANDLGAEVFYNYLRNFGLMEKTGIDLPGEATGIFHPLEKVGPVELATMSFGQSFQITSMQLLRAASAIINGGQLITPHVGMRVLDDEGNVVEEFMYDKGEQVITEATSSLMGEILESVVFNGTGNRTYLPGYRVGGKTATSEKLPRRQGKYISSFLAFAPAEDPKVVALVLIDEPKGAYYGGQVAGPVMKELLTNALPMLGIAPDYNEQEKLLPDINKVEMPDLVGINVSEAKKILKVLKLEAEIRGLDSGLVSSQFPIKGTAINPESTIILYVE